METMNLIVAYSTFNYLYTLLGDNQSYVLRSEGLNDLNGQRTVLG